MEIRDIIRTLILPADLKATPDGREIVIEDISIQGFSADRNVARIRLERSGEVLVNLFEGAYKPSNYKPAKNLDQAVDQALSHYSQRKLEQNKKAKEQI